MTSGLQKFGLLLWKNYVLQKRHKIQTIVELVVPLFFTAVLVGIRGIVSSDQIKEPTIFVPFDVNNYQNTSVPGGCFILYAPKNPLTEELINHIIETKLTFNDGLNETRRSYTGIFIYVILISKEDYSRFLNLK